MKSALHKTNQKGFTLIELLVVIGILAVLLAIVLIAINPARQFRLANDTQRRSNVNTILNAIHQFMAENKGILPADMPAAGAPREEISGAAANICGDLIPDYVAAIPVDPLVTAGEVDETACTAGTYDTNYTVEVGTGNRITICAPDTEEDPTEICVTR